MTEDKTRYVTCCNSKCKRSFAQPIPVHDLSSGKTYSGCPFCLTEINEKTPFSPTCQHYLGYLSERSKNEKIPDECIQCEKTIECMLFQLKKSDKAIDEIQKWYC